MCAQSRNMHMQPWRLNVNPLNTLSSRVSQALVNHVHVCDLDPYSHNYPWMDVKTPICWILIVNKLVSFRIWSGIKASKKSLCFLPTSAMLIPWGVQIHNLTYFSAFHILVLQCGQMNYMWTLYVDVFTSDGIHCLSQGQYRKTYIIKYTH